MDIDDKTSKKWWAPAIKLFAQMTAWVAGPIIIAVYLGSWLDTKFDKSPWLFLLSVGIAFIITNIAIVKQGKESIKEMEEFNKDEPSKSTKK